MAVTAAVAGAGLIAAGTAAAIKANKMKTQGRKVNYGGSAAATDQLKQTYAAGADQGNKSFTEGVAGLNNVRGQGLALTNARPGNHEQRGRHSQLGSTGMRGANCSRNTSQVRLPLLRPSKRWTRTRRQCPAPLVRAAR
jgi:hypothetical protein